MAKEMLLASILFVGLVCSYGIVNSLSTKQSMVELLTDYNTTIEQQKKK
jgi:hypothetical protein